MTTFQIIPHHASQAGGAAVEAFFTQMNNGHGDEVSLKLGVGVS